MFLVEYLENIDEHVGKKNGRGREVRRQDETRKKEVEIDHPKVLSPGHKHC